MGNDEKAIVIDQSSRTPCLRVTDFETWWVFPWMHFLYAKGDDDQVQAVFTTHDVVIKGRGMLNLITYLQQHWVVRIQPSPRSERFDVDEADEGQEPFVEEIIINEAGRK